MAQQLDRYFASLDMLDALQSRIRIIYVPRDPEAPMASSADAAVNAIRMTDEIEQLLSQLDPSEADVLRLRFRVGRSPHRFCGIVPLGPHSQ